MRTIAQMTGLSVTTVSHALNGTRQVSKRSMDLINEAAAKINYRPNLAAQMMKTQRSRTVALIIPETEQNNSTNCFFFDVMNGAKSCLAESSYELIVSLYPESKANDFFSGMSVLNRRWVDGILLVPPTLKAEDISFIEGCGVPIVLIDRWVEGKDLPMVSSNNREITAQAIHELYRQGRRRIGFIGAAMQNSSAVERYQGYVDALENLGLPLEEALVCCPAEYNLASGMAAAEQVMRQQVDAIFIANSMLSFGVVKQLQQSGVRMPEDIALIGFENYEWSEITDPPLSAVIQNARLMGRTASEQLLKLLDGEPLEQNQIRIPAKLNLRQSHGF